MNNDLFKPLLIKSALLVFVFSLLAPSGFAGTSNQMKVGGYPFPPFIIFDGQTYSGVVLDLIELLNEKQTAFHFQFTPTSAKRRYYDLSARHFDALMFESINWGWIGKDVQFSNTLLSSKEIYIALALPDRDQFYFTELNQKRLVGVLGYHYRFADYISDAEFLTKHFDINLVSSMNTVVKQIQHHQADIGVVTSWYFEELKKNNVSLSEKLLEGKEPDHIYDQKVVLSKKSPISLDDLNALIADIKQSGELKEIYSRYGIR